MARATATVRAARKARNSAARKADASKADAVRRAADATVSAAPADASAPTAPPVSAPTVPTGRQTLANVGRDATRALRRPTVRRALLGTIGEVKRGDIVSPTSDPFARALERLQRADIRATANALLALATFVDTIGKASKADATGCNVATVAGSVSAAGLAIALADASSKADALGMFASAD